MKSVDQNKSTFSEVQLLKDDINWNKLFEIIIRYKRNLIAFTGLGLIIGILVAIGQKRIWEGQFQIVLSSEKSSRASQILSSQVFSRFIDTGNLRSELNTQIEILKSPSVLMPIFLEIKNKKEALGQNVKNWKYERWFNESIKIDLKKGTSVLVLNYRDANKNLILPTLDKISQTFQGYSGIKKQSGLEEGIQYLNQQISIYRNKSNISSSKAISYAIDNKLDNSQISNNNPKVALSNTNNVNLPNNTYSSIGYTSSLSEVMKDLKLTNQTLEKINDKSLSKDQIIGISSSIKNPGVYEILDLLNEVELKLSKAKVSFKQEDIVVKNLILEKEILLSSLEEKARKVLNSKRMELSILSKSLERPKEVLLKYRELLNQASRDESTLSALLQQQRLLSLDLAKKSKPWELITKATISDYPVGTSRKLISLIGLVCGFFAGLFFGVYKSSKDKIVYSTIELEELFQAPILLSLPNNIEYWNKDLNLLHKSSKLKNNKEIGLISLGKTEANSKNLIIKKFNSIDKNYQLKKVDELVDLNNFSAFIILGKLGLMNENEINLLIEKLLLIDSALLGIIALKE